MTRTALRGPLRRSPWLGGTRVLLGLFGALKLHGTAYFTFFAPAGRGGDPRGLGDWTVAVWSAALAGGFLMSAVRLGKDPRVPAVLAGVVLLDLAFSAVKLTVYDEPEAVAFMTVDLVVLALLAFLRRNDG